MRWAAVGCRWILGGLFLVAGVMKAAEPGGFLRDVAGYALVDGWGLVVVGFLLPYLEIVTGAALVLRRPYRGAVLVAGAMLAIFLAALVQAWVRGLDISCGCFGGAGGTSDYPWWVARDLALMCACAVCWWDAGRRRAGKAVVT